MGRILRRFPEFEVALTFQDETFAKTPRDAQRTWLVNRMIGEFVDELKSLHARAASLRQGTDPPAMTDRTNSKLAPHEIMEDWQIPIMQAMAEVAGEQRGDVLEIGFGRGVSATFLQQQAIRSHTIIECNETLVPDFERWRADYLDRDIRWILGKWQDANLQDAAFDSVFFHAYPLTPSEHVDYVVKSLTFAQHFFETAARILRPGGVFTYLTNEDDSLGRGHQRALFEHFNSITVSVVDGLEIPADTRDATWTDSMVIVKAVK